MPAPVVEEELSVVVQEQSKGLGPLPGLEEDFPFYIVIQ